MDTFAPLILSIVAIFVSTAVAIFTWHKNRVIYGILTVNDRDKKATNLLKTGKYTILNVHQPDANDSTRTIYTLGKVKK